MQMGFYFDQTRCTGCLTCAIACKDWHDIPAGPTRLRQVITIEKGRFPDVFVAFLSTGCYHCAKPACVEACPEGAITKRGEDGIVVVDREHCLGKDECALCLSACPYEAPQFGAGENAKMEICNFCFDRLADKKQPVCVAGCPMRALDAGPMDELVSRYGGTNQAEGFIYSIETKPSIVFRPKTRP
jgi:anaerobic dimethyl sulfoxide reductase subunit B (iron-sulfur subunit)